MLTRSVEYQALLNPAYICVGINGLAAGYEERTGHGISMSLCFVAIPLSVHEPTRRLFPANANAKLINWVLDNRTVLLGYPNRARNLGPAVRNGLQYGLGSGSLALEGHYIRSVTKLASKASALNTSVEDMYKQSRKLGMLLARAGSPATVFALLGVAP